MSESGNWTKRRVKHSKRKNQILILKGFGEVLQKIGWKLVASLLCGILWLSEMTPGFLTNIYLNLKLILTHCPQKKIMIFSSNQNGGRE
jgi:hypothetical protein